MLLKVTNTSGSAVPVTAFAIHNFKLGSASNPDVARCERRGDRWNGTVATETGPGGGAMVYAPIGGADVSSCDRERVHDRARRRHADDARRAAAAPIKRTRSRRTSARSRPVRRRGGASRCCSTAAATRARHGDEMGDVPQRPRRRQAARRPARRVGHVSHGAAGRPDRRRDQGVAPGRGRAAHGPDHGAVPGQPAPEEPRHDPRELAARRLAHRVGARRDVRDHRVRAHAVTPIARRTR